MVTEGGHVHLDALAAVNECWKKGAMEMWNVNTK